MKRIFKNFRQLVSKKKGFSEGKERYFILDKVMWKGVREISIFNSLAYIPLGFLLEHKNILLHSAQIFLGSFCIMFIAMLIIKVFRIDSKKWNPYKGGKLVLKSKKFFLIVTVPAFIISMIALIITIISNCFYEALFEKFVIEKIFIAMCFFDFILATLADGIQAEYRKFKESDGKGKLLAIVVFILVLLKEIYEMTLQS